MRSIAQRMRCFWALWVLFSVSAQVGHGKREFQKKYGRIWAGKINFFTYAHIVSRIVPRVMLKDCKVSKG